MSAKDKDDELAKRAHHFRGPIAINEEGHAIGCLSSDGPPGIKREFVFADGPAEIDADYTPAPTLGADLTLTDTTVAEPWMLGPGKWIVNVPVGATASLRGCPWVVEPQEFKPLDAVDPDAPVPGQFAEKVFAQGTMIGTTAERREATDEEKNRLRLGCAVTALTHARDLTDSLSEFLWALRVVMADDGAEHITDALRPIIVAEAITEAAREWIEDEEARELGANLAREFEGRSLSLSEVRNATWGEVMHRRIHHGLVHKDGRDIEDHEHIEIVEAIAQAWNGAT